MIEALQTWESTWKELLKQCDALSCLTGAEFAGPLFDAIFKLASEYTKAVAEIVGDDDEWMEWYEMDNEFGRRGFEAGRNGELRKISCVEDLLWLIRG